MLAAVLPLSNWLRRNPGKVPMVWMLVGFLPFVMVEFHLLMAVVSHNYWPGHVSGVDVTVLDAVILALNISLPSSRHRLPFQLPMVLYFLAVLLSVLQAESPTEALFYPWQLARMYLVYLTIARASAVDERVAPALLKGMTAGLLLEAVLVVWQRVVLGHIEADGTFAGHSFLGLVSHFTVFPNFALLLAGARGYLPGVAVLAGLIVEVLTTSRATIGLAALGFSMLLSVSFLRRLTARKIQVLSIGLAAIVLLAPLAVSSFEKRFGAERTSDADFDERVAFETAAAMILSDHPLGVGPNHYVVVASKNYNRLAGVPQVSGENDAFVHNIYRLVAAETGYPGLITFLLLLICPIIVAFRCGWQNRRDQRGDLLIGIGVALLIVYLHSLYEWIFINFQSQYLFVMEVGLVAGLAEQLGYWRRRPYRQDIRLGTNTPSMSAIRNTRGLEKRIWR